MLLRAAPLTPSGRPVLQPGEVEVSLLDKVDLEFHPSGGLAGQTAEAYKDGYVILTNRQLIWVEAGGAGRGGGGGGGAPRAVALPLAAVAGSSKRVQYSLKGPKVRLQLEVYADAQRQAIPASGFHTSIGLLSLRCRGPAPDAFKALMDEHVRQAVAADAAAAASGGAGGAGINGAAARPSAAAAPPPPPLNAAASPLRAGLQARLSPRPGEFGGGGVGGVGGGGSPARAYASSPSPPPPPSQQQQPDPGLLQAMVEMGFPRNRCARSLLATGNAGVQEALDYMLAFGDQPGMDDPLDQPTTATAGTGAPYQPSPPGPPTAAGGGRYPSILPGPTSTSPPPPPPPPYPSADPPSYGGLLYGGGDPSLSYGGGGVRGSAMHGAASASSVRQLGDGLAAMSLRPYPHQYGSAPDLGSTAAAAAGGGGGGAAAIGVAGILQREQQKTAESGRAVEQAFRDMSALMTSAATMVALAEKFRGVMAAGQDGAAATAGGGEDPLLLDAETQAQLIALGISSPVTRETAGARYHIELSRQLADFLAAPLARCGGLISLPDVYCLFNRARGTELVSPDDLLQAAKLFGRAGVPGLRLRPLSSGVLVIQGPQHSEEQVCAKIAELTTPPRSPAPAPPPSPPSPPSPQQPPPSPPPPSPPPPLGPGLTASDVSRALGGISLAIASEHLLTAEARGVVLRDDGPEGLRFYRNFLAQDGGLLAAAAALGRA